MTVLNLDCRHGLAMLPDASVDAVICDPPYELGFMGHAWDRSGVAYDVAMWRECLRVLKPGGYLLAFSGSRTYHRMASAIEDAGAEIRDSIMWVYGSGFPKSLNLSKAIDQHLGAEREVLGQRDVGPDMTGNNYGRDDGVRMLADITAPATLAAQVWDGWGTALKPAHEPICMARKPLAGGTVAANVLAYGVGGINVDGCRVPIDPAADAGQLRTMSVSQHDGADGWGMNTSRANPAARVLGDEGRWPANFIHDGSPEVLAAFPDAGGAKAPVLGHEASPAATGQVCNYRDRVAGPEPRGDSGSAARFFYCAKASKRDRNEGLDHMPAVQTNFAAGTGLSKNGDGTPRNLAPTARNTHPTVKPTDLMRYLCRLVCPPGGLIVDPFAGSGSTGKAAILEGFQFIGFELEPSYAELANCRLSAARRA